MNPKLKGAVIGGVLLGLLSAIPFVNFVNVCCCAWVLLGGAVATMICVKGSPTRVTVGGGAGVGALAGVIGGVIYVIIALPINLLMGNSMIAFVYGLIAKFNPAQADQLNRMLELQARMGVGERLLAAIPGLCIAFVLIVVFATLGGLIGVPIFEKRKDGTVGPPPPQGFNAPPTYGQPGGGY